MLSEDAAIARRIGQQSSAIERAIKAILRAFQRKGRLLYVGAGTSGRLGVLDASECPPTFGTAPQMVQGIIAGGDAALRKAVEGAEDDAKAGKEAMRARRINARDVVVGITASGTTPFVWGAIEEAKRHGAATVLLCCNPFVQVPRALRPRYRIALNLGPEVLTGSTRLKAGTATKMVLNMFTTLAMVKLGKVRGNLMADLRPTNAKLRARAARIAEELAGVDGRRARTALEVSGWNVKKAVARLAKK
jgi:N-acetylmuramic acid 6-phosphate etherase